VGHKEEGINQLFEILFGEDSELFGKFRTKFGVKCFKTYCLFMVTFFLECRFSIMYSQLWEDSKVNTSNYMDVGEYLKMWSDINDYHKDERFNNRAWEEIEDALNKVCKVLCFYVIYQRCSSLGGPGMTASIGTTIPSA